MLSNTFIQWQQECEKLIENRVPISKLSTMFDIGKRKKFDLPEKIKNEIEEMQKITKDIKRIFLEKAPQDKLLEI